MHNRSSARRDQTMMMKRNWLCSWFCFFLAIFRLPFDEFYLGRGRSNVIIPSPGIANITAHRLLSDRPLYTMYICPFYTTSILRHLGQWEKALAPTIIPIFSSNEMIIIPISKNIHFIHIYIITLSACNTCITVTLDFSPPTNLFVFKIYIET